MLPLPLSYRERCGSLKKREREHQILGLAKGTSTVRVLVKGKKKGIKAGSVLLGDAGVYSPMPGESDP